MNPFKATELISTLIESTRYGNLEWTSNALKRGFIARLGGAFLELKKNPPSVTSALRKDTYRLEIRKDDGTVVDAVEDDPTDSPFAAIGASGLPQLWKMVSGDDSDAFIDKIIDSAKKLRGT